MRLVALVLTLSSGVSFAAIQDGAALYRQHCAACHDPAVAGLTPNRNVLRELPVEAILLALEVGAMKSYGETLSPEERVAISEYVAEAPSASQPRTLRLDYYHTGNSGEEKFARDGVAVEGAWPGRADRNIDTTGLGKYFFEVQDGKTKKVLYSRGFASVFGEWETTDEARREYRTFHESLRFPAPEGRAAIVLKKREKSGGWREVWSTDVDPASLAVDQSGPSGRWKVWEVMKNGEPKDKVDLLLLGDGYTASEMAKWHRDARHMTELLFSVSPFKERRNDFNVWAMDTPAEVSGVSRPSDGIYRKSPLRASYDALGSERYVLSLDNKRLREIAAAVPYEFIEIIVNGRKYGGGGIYNLHATVASDNAFTPYIFVHEFGHHFAALADEYYTSEVAYGSSSDRPEPWEPNATADPRAGKWSELLAPGVPFPTPWPKDVFEEFQRDIQARRKDLRARRRPEEEMESLFREELQKTSALLGAAPYAGKVGAFEGAMYEARGYYRPQADCIMFTRDEVGFCAVCRRAIERMIDFYIGR